MTGTELEIIPPERSQIAGSDAERQPSLQTTARTDLELLAVWLKSHVDGSDHTVRAYGRIGRRFLDALKVAGVDLRRATLDDVQTALDLAFAIRGGGDKSVLFENCIVSIIDVGAYDENAAIKIEFSQKTDLVLS